LNISRQNCVIKVNIKCTYFDSFQFYTKINLETCDNSWKLYYLKEILSETPNLISHSEIMYMLANCYYNVRI